MKRLFLVAIVGLAARGFAAERVTLANGFSMDCHHHALVDGKMRLYTQPGEKNYIELEPEKVAAIETVPDPIPTTESGAGAPFVAQPYRATGGDATTDTATILTTAGHAHNLDVALLASVVKAESGGNPRARSRAGAQGLMQLMPKTASDLGVTDSYAPEQNVRGGAAYLDALLTRYHEDLTLALAAYNAGPEKVDKYHGIPPYHETRAYVARVIREFNRRVHEREMTARRGGL